MNHSWILTPMSLSKTKLNSIAPIHSRDPINDGSLSPISTRDCCISLKHAKRFLAPQTVMNNFE